MGVRDGTVSKVLRHLQKHGYVTVHRYRGVKLTPKGREIAMKVIRNHRILEIFLYDFLGFDAYKAHELAHRMEHLPQEVIDAIYEKMGRPETCIYGYSIDPRYPPPVLTLDKSEPGKCYMIVCVVEELAKIIEKLKEAGCFICCRVKVESKGSRGLVLRVEGGRKLILSLEDARTIGAEEVSCDDFEKSAVSECTSRMQVQGS